MDQIEEANLQISLGIKEAKHKKIQICFWVMPLGIKMRVYLDSILKKKKKGIAK